MAAALQRSACLIASVLLSLMPVKSVSSELSRPNVLFLVVDDLRPKLGCYGETNMVTPNIDQLAAKSLVFERAYVQQAICSPSRTSFLTGRRPDTTRTYDLHVYFRNIAGNYTTLPQHFKNNGYITQSVGKIFHPGPTSGNTDDYPFSWTFPARHAPSRKYFTDKICPGPDGKLYNNAVCPLERSQIPSGKLPDEENADFAVSFLQNRSVDQKPFFLALGFHKPHLPFRYDAKYKDLYPLSKIKIADNQNVPMMMPYVSFSPWDHLRTFQDIRALNVSWPFGVIPKDFQYLMRQSYSAATSFTDGLVGRVLAALDQSGFANNTIITFHGDHGWHLGEHMEWTKHTNFDIALRIPLMFHVPGVTAPKLPPGKTFPFKDALKMPIHENTRHTNDPLTNDGLVEAVDIYPTISELAGLDIPPTCSRNPFSETFCTEGASFASLIKSVAKDVTITSDTFRDVSKSSYQIMDTNIASSGLNDMGIASSKGTDVTRMSTGHRTSRSKVQWKRAVFSQYPRPSFFPSRSTIDPSLNEIIIMGYTMRTDKQRYTEWVAYDHTTFSANWTHVYARELYDYSADPEGNFNVVDVPAYSDLAVQLAQQLRDGWRSVLPGTS
ncbi:iduronate 2-sulfatase-like [Littorina saxatilis]|uniref:Sulfatase N-terminal domain-containing protein n=1 Tax=Littorina saxatilis TaxID=31220 RepID=A0AAN9B2A0_9CAEN